jgi:hypothetical protein
MLGIDPLEPVCHSQAHVRSLATSLLFAVACGNADSGSSPSASSSAAAPGAGAVLQAAENQTATSSSAKAAPAAKPVVDIPAGSFSFGSLPGDRGRNAALEPVAAQVEVSAFDIDRLYYPNEPGTPPLLTASREKAAELCKSRGRRLCTELEWERACKGPDGNEYAGQGLWDSACSERPSSCASGFGVLGLGSYREWTASSREGEGKSQGIIKGAPKGGSDLERRCAARKPLESSNSDGSVAFRCCGGSANERAVPEPIAKPSFEKTELAPAELELIFSAVPELSKLKPPVKYFEEESAKKEVVQRAKEPDTKGYELITSPLIWRPERGEELVLVTGQAGEDAFILALHRLPEGKHRIASSLILRKEPAPVVLAFDRSVSTRLAWATCWQCPSESGKISYRDDRRIIITQE